MTLRSGRVHHRLQFGTLTYFTWLPIDSLNDSNSGIDNRKADRASMFVLIVNKPRTHDESGPL